MPKEVKSEVYELSRDMRAIFVDVHETESWIHFLGLKCTFKLDSLMNLGIPSGVYRLLCISAACT